MSEIMRWINPTRRETGSSGPAQKEIERVPVDLVDQLLDEAHDRFDGDNYDSYRLYSGDGLSATAPNKYAVPLAPVYEPLLLGDKADRYKIVTYADYRSGSNPRPSRNVLLSTSSTKAAAGDHLKEISYMQENGEKTVQVNEWINGSHIHEFKDLPDLAPEKVVKPRGKAEAKYAIGQNGESRLLSAHVMRKEGVILSGDEETKALWARGLMINNEGYFFDRGRPIMYSDSYRTEGAESAWGLAEFIIAGTLEKPKQITIQIGNFPGNKELAEGPDGLVRIMMGKEVNAQAHLAVLSRDSAYDFLFDGDALKAPSFDEVHEFVHGRVAQLQRDWNNPQNIFLKNTLE